MRPNESLEISELVILCRAHSSIGSGRKVGQTKPWLRESRVEICQTKYKWLRLKNELKYTNNIFQPWMFELKNSKYLITHVKHIKHQNCQVWAFEFEANLQGQEKIKYKYKYQLWSLESDPVLEVKCTLCRLQESPEPHSEEAFLLPEICLLNINSTNFISFVRE